jgi:hypothetical protein
LGSDLSALRPGSEAAQRLKQQLQQRGAWSQYMEVGIGPDAEVFTKAQAMSSGRLRRAGGLAAVVRLEQPGARDRPGRQQPRPGAGASWATTSTCATSKGERAVVGQGQGQQRFLRHRPLHPPVRRGFTLDTVCQAEVSLLIEGADDGFVLEGASFMREISRDPLDLVRQTAGAHHQYPDGFMLFLGTMFSPVKDRGAQGGGFTHHLGDRVTIASAALGALVNKCSAAMRSRPGPLACAPCTRTWRSAA